MTVVSLSPVCNIPVLVNLAGNPLSGGMIYTYQAGSTTMQSISYSDAAGTIPNANPVILDSSGRPNVEFWLVDGQGYHFILQDNQGNVIATYDNVEGIYSGVTSFNTRIGAVTLLPADIQNALGYLPGPFLSNTKTITSGGSTVGVFSINLANSQNGCANVQVMLSMYNALGGVRLFTRNSIIVESGTGTLTESNVVTVNGANGIISGSISATTLTISITSTQIPSGTSESVKASVLVNGQSVTLAAL